jgi:hypothetical protein
MSGFLTDLTIINPQPLGAGGVKWVVSLPSYVVREMHKQFPNVNILLGPGYSFSLYSSGDGLIKETGIDGNHKPITNGITEVYE